MTASTSGMGRRIAGKLCRHAKRLRWRLFPFSDDIETVIIAGVQRSGTNMVLELLDAHFRTAVVGENDPRAYDNYDLKNPDIIRALRDQLGAPVFVLKALLESDHVVRLLGDLSPAKLIWLVRGVDDMVNSNMRSWPGGRNQIEDVVRDPATADFRGRGMTGETLEILRRHYRPDTNDATAIALFWWYRHRLLFDQALDRDQRTAVLFYEDIVASPGEGVDALCDFLDLSPASRMAAVLHPRSVGKHPAPDIEPPVKALCEDMQERLKNSSRLLQFSPGGPACR